ncbi:MAG: sulfatase-like hydrolase/transferase [Cyclobacteriaceae bacterium]
MRILFLAAVVITLFTHCTPEPRELPNILWITSEDNSTFLGCYGDEFATTPNLDKLASEGFLYTHAYANAPVCAPARNTIISGIYAISGGNQHMRSKYLKSDKIKPYPLFLRELGYYCTNNSKTDYNIREDQVDTLWNESSKDAHYKNRAEGQPFFAIFNTTITHESSIHKSIPNEELRHDPEQVPIPPHHPRTEEMKHDWAQYYDKMEDMDAYVGERLKELEESGLAENTIVFYYGDHGGVLARSKRYVYESGTHVPFIVRIPEKFKYLFPADEPGSMVDRLISFVDLAPTLLSIVGIPIPDFMQGDAFLGDQKSADPEYAFMFRGRMDERYDMSRAVRSQKYRYIRNYMPHRIYGQHLNYLWRAPSIRSWEEAYLNGECNETQSIFWEPKPSEELYDTENDPWEVNNLADDPKYAEVMKKMRKANQQWMLRIRDTGFVPEPSWAVRRGEQPFYDLMRKDSEIDLERLIEVAEASSLRKFEDINVLIYYLRSEDPAIRYWGATGLLIQGEKSKPAIADLKNALKDESDPVAIVAAEALYRLGEKELAENTLTEKISGSEFVSTFAMNAIDINDISSAKIKQAVVAHKSDKNQYDQRMVEWLMEKWEIAEE